MPTTYETGHAKNVANFEAMITAVATYGTNYNPSMPAIKLAALQAQLSAAQQTVDKVNTALANYGNATAIRNFGYEPLHQLCSRMISALKATDAPQQVVDRALSNHRKLMGTRVSAKLGQEELAALKAVGKEVKQVSASQQSYDNILDTFDKQVKLLASIPQYQPNETDLKVSTLETLFTALQTKNTAVWTAKIALDTARIERNKIVYEAKIGVIAITKDVKNYVKSLFGPSSPQYKHLSALTFIQFKG
jgi:hypothetical protein